jgi:hypothetical protein
MAAAKLDLPDHPVLTKTPARYEVVSRYAVRDSDSLSDKLGAAGVLSGCLVSSSRTVADQPQ